MKTRIISAIVALAIVIPVIYVGGYLFCFAAGVIGFIGFRELMKLKEIEKDIPNIVKLIAIVSFLFLMLNNLDIKSNLFLADFQVLTAIVFFMLSPMVFIHDFKKYNINDALFLIGAIFFLGIAFNYLITVRLNNIYYFVFLLLTTIMTDTFAQLVGSLVGKHKLAPVVSPNKTWEGLIGGSILGTFVSTVFYISVFDFTGNIFVLTMIVFALTLIGQLGDLIFSSIKRYYKVKDFSNIMPGHGGILDRLDSILFVVLAFSFVIGLI